MKNNSMFNKSCQILTYADDSDIISRSETVVSKDAAKLTVAQHEEDEIYAGNSRTRPT